MAGNEERYAAAAPPTGLLSIDYPRLALALLAKADWVISGISIVFNELCCGMLWYAVHDNGITAH